MSREGPAEAGEERISLGRERQALPRSLAFALTQELRPPHLYLLQLPHCHTTTSLPNDYLNTTSILPRYHRIIRRVPRPCAATFAAARVAACGSRRSQSTLSNTFLRCVRKLREWERAKGAVAWSVRRGEFSARGEQR